MNRTDSTATYADVHALRVSHADDYHTAAVDVEGRERPEPWGGPGRHRKEVYGDWKADRVEAHALRIALHEEAVRQQREALGLNPHGGTSTTMLAAGIERATEVTARQIIELLRSEPAGLTREQIVRRLGIVEWRVKDSLGILTATGRATRHQPAMNARYVYRLAAVAAAG